MLATSGIILSVDNNIQLNYYINIYLFGVAYVRQNIARKGS